MLIGNVYSNSWLKVLNKPSMSLTHVDNVLLLNIARFLFQVLYIGEKIGLFKLTASKNVF